LAVPDSRTWVAHRAPGAARRGDGVDPGRQIAARGDVKLGVRVAEVRVDGLGGDEQRLRDLAIGETVDRESRDPQFTRGEGVPTAGRIASRRGLAPVVISSSRACAAIRRAPQWWAMSRPRCSGARALTR
jgi:hypothetical protein